MAISPTFLDRLAAWGVADKSTVVPNWAPSTSSRCVTAMRTMRGGRDAGSRGHPVVLYSGTLGLKHDPGILAHDRRAAGGVASRGRGSS